MTHEEIMRALHKMDLSLRPYAIVCNPVDAELLKQVMPDCEERLKLYASDIIESGNAYVINRAELEKFEPLKLIYGEEES